MSKQEFSILMSGQFRTHSCKVLQLSDVLSTKLCLKSYDSFNVILAGNFSPVIECLQYSKYHNK